MKMMDLRFIVMKMLSKQAMNGYSLQKNASQLLGKEVSSGALYPALKNLEADKFIVIENKVEEGRFKKLYSLTDKGRIGLKEEEVVLKKLMDLDRSGIKLQVVEADE